MLSYNSQYANFFKNVTLKNHKMTLSHKLVHKINIIILCIKGEMKEVFIKFKFYLIPFSVSLGFWCFVVILRIVFTNINSAWYTQLYKPVFYPPAFVFWLCWSLVYASLITSTTLALKLSQNKMMHVNVITNGILNIFWCLFFFTLKSPLTGVVVLLFLLLSSIYLLKTFLKIKSWTAYILIPYLIWILYLIVINYSVLMIN